MPLPIRTQPVWLDAEDMNCTQSSASTRQFHIDIWTKTFSSDVAETEFVQSCAGSIARGLRRVIFLALLLSSMGLVMLLLSQSTVQTEQICVLATILTISILAWLSTAATLINCMRPRWYESCAVVYFSVALLLAVSLDPRHTAIFAARDSANVSGDVGIGVDDSSGRLCISFSLCACSVLVASHFLVPLRWIALVFLEGLSVVLYACAIALWGPPLWQPKVVELIAFLLVLFCVATGKRNLEVYERRSFMELGKHGPMRRQVSTTSQGTLIGQAGACSTESHLTSVVVSPGSMCATGAGDAAQNENQPVLRGLDAQESVEITNSSASDSGTQASKVRTLTRDAEAQTTRIVAGGLDTQESAKITNNSASDSGTQASKVRTLTRDAEAQTAQIVLRPSACGVEIPTSSAPRLTQNAETKTIGTASRPPATPMQRPAVKNKNARLTRSRSAHQARDLVDTEDSDSSVHLDRILCANRAGKTSRASDPGGNARFNLGSAPHASPVSSVASTPREPSLISAMPLAALSSSAAGTSRGSMSSITASTPASSPRASQSTFDWQPACSFDGQWGQLVLGEWLRELDVCGDLCLDGVGRATTLQKEQGGDLIFCGGVMVAVGHYLRYTRKSGASITYVYVGPTEQSGQHKRFDFGLDGVWKPIKQNTWLLSLSIHGDQVVDGSGLTSSLQRKGNSSAVCFRGGVLRLCGEYLVYHGRKGATTSFERIETGAHEAFFSSESARTAISIPGVRVVHADHCGTESDGPSRGAASTASVRAADPDERGNDSSLHVDDSNAYTSKASGSHVLGLALEMVTAEPGSATAAEEP